MGNHMKTFQNLTGLVYQDESVFAYLRPLRGNVMQVPSLRKELSAHGIWRDDNLSLLIMFNEVPQAASMIAVSVRNEDIAHIAEIYAQLLCVSDKHIACSSVKQDLVPLCLQKD